jgi:hypothetical protein
MDEVKFCYAMGIQRVDERSRFSPSFHPPASSSGFCEKRCDMYRHILYSFSNRVRIREHISGVWFAYKLHLNTW